MLEEELEKIEEAEHRQSEAEKSAVPKSKGVSKRPPSQGRSTEAEGGWTSLGLKQSENEINHTVRAVEAQREKRY